jgi:hypothetical protein
MLRVSNSQLHYFYVLLVDGQSRIPLGEAQTTSTSHERQSNLTIANFSENFNESAPSDFLSHPYNYQLSADSLPRTDKYFIFVYANLWLIVNIWTRTEKLH